LESNSICSFETYSVFVHLQCVWQDVGLIFAFSCFGFACSNSELEIGKKNYVVHSELELMFFCMLCNKSCANLFEVMCIVESASRTLSGFW
jgi:hypothetical protein